MEYSSGRGSSRRRRLALAGGAEQREEAPLQLAVGKVGEGLRPHASIDDRHSSGAFRASSGHKGRKKQASRSHHMGMLDGSAKQEGNPSAEGRGSAALLGTARECFLFLFLLQDKVSFLLQLLQVTLCIHHKLQHFGVQLLFSQ